MSLIIKKMWVVVGLVLVGAQINGADARVPANEDRCTAKILAFLKFSKPDLVLGRDGVERAIHWSHFLHHPVQVKQGENPYQLVAEGSRACHGATYKTPEVDVIINSVLVRHLPGLVWRDPRDGRRQCFPGYLDASGETVIINSLITDQTTGFDKKTGLYKESMVFGPEEAGEDWYTKVSGARSFDRWRCNTVIPLKTFLELTRDSE
jgi:hypothetical protein